jgi:hypothetical protein
MDVYPLMKARERFWVNLPPEDVLDNISKHIEEGTLRGNVSPETHFSVGAMFRGRSSWRPRMSGTLVAINQGTMVDVQLSVTPVVRIFTIIHGLFMFGLSWLIGIAAFSAEVSKSMLVLQAAVGGDASGEALSDPLTAAAEAQPPWSLQPSIDIDQVIFQVYGPNTMLGLPSQTTLTVSPAGLRLQLQSKKPVELTWHAVTFIKHRQDKLIIKEHTIDCSRHPPEHVRWLMSYLHAQSRRNAATTAERDAFKDNAQRLSAMRGTDTTRT